VSVVALVAAFLALLLTGLVGGFYLALSISVMTGLAATGARAAIGSMQRINQAIINSVFFATFMATPLVCAAAAGLLLLIGEQPAAFCFAAAAVIYIAGTFFPTLVASVPLNETLARSPIPDSEAEAELIWSAYSSRWSLWNYVRAAACFLSLLMIGLGLLLWRTFPL
jgi:uncharacterized membrane protein